MTNTFKRRVCLLSLLSVTCLLCGIFLSDLEDIGITNFQLDLASFILLFAGIIIAFKTLETWSFWNEDNSEDKNENQRTRNPYPIAFYTEAAITILITFSLLVFILVRKKPNQQEFLISVFSLFVAGACVLMGRLSTGIE
jgi:hypothetical protein